MELFGRVCQGLLKKKWHRKAPTAQATVTTTVTKEERSSFYTGITSMTSSYAPIALCKRSRNLPIGVTAAFAETPKEVQRLTIGRCQPLIVGSFPGVRPGDLARASLLAGGEVIHVALHAV
jgi:hypothetical protein